MNATDLRTALSSLAISQADLARLANVTTRAVNLWATGVREVPGPVTAYVNLLLSLPRALQVQEFSRLEERSIVMEGMYSFRFQGRSGDGIGILVLMAGRVFGSDGDVIYDGTYQPSATAAHIDLELLLTVPPNTNLVQGVPAQPVETRFPVRATVPARGQGAIRVGTPFGPVEVMSQYLRDVPQELAA